MRRRRVLISEPNAAGEQYAFLPYMWAILKTHWERHGSDRTAFDWLDPLYNRDSVAAELGIHAGAPPDVLGLSCYTWNWDLQCEIARWAKQRNPSCLVVAGGPDPDYKDPEYFRRHPYIDVIVVKDGEIPFTRILDTLLADDRDLGRIPGLYLPRGSESPRAASDSMPHRFTGAAEVLKSFDYSPYLEQSAFYERISKARGGGRLNATWETNRGCPYGCSFCDWGSATLSKVRRFDMARVEAEADWLGRMGINFVFLADANFGILPRDVEIADHLAAARAKYGYPKFLYYSAAKNNPERTVEIARRTFAAKLTNFHILAVQHTDPEVLRATERSNIPSEKYRDVVATLLALDIPSEVQLILGIPGDTPEKWKACLGEIMDWGVHDNYTTFPYSLLPNAPASEPHFRDKWRMETVDRWLTAPVVRRSRSAVEGFAKSRVVVACRSYSRGEWRDMSTYAAFIKAYHNRALTRLPAVYLRFCHDVAYRDFYGAVIDGFCAREAPVAALYARVQEHYERFLLDPDASDEMELEDLPDFPFYVDASRWLFVKTCLNLDAFYGALADFLTVRYPQAQALRSAIEYQRSLVILPDYQPQHGRIFASDHDWPAFIGSAYPLSRHQRLPEPVSFQVPVAFDAGIEPARSRGWLDFGDGHTDARWSRWIEQCVRFENASTWSNFDRVERACREQIQIPG